MRSNKNKLSKERSRTSRLRFFIPKSAHAFRTRKFRKPLLISGAAAVLIGIIITGSIMLSNLGTSAVTGRLQEGSTITYTVTAKYDGIDASGITSSASQSADVYSGRLVVEDYVPANLTNVQMTKGSLASQGTGSCSSGSIVVDPTYNSTTGLVTFTVDKLQAGCQIPVTITATVPTRSSLSNISRVDFNNVATIRNQNTTATSESLNTFIGPSKAATYTISYAVSGAPSGSVTAPATETAYAGQTVRVAEFPQIDGYTLATTTSSGTLDASTGTLTMPSSNITITGTYTADSSTSYSVTYQTTGATPYRYEVPAPKTYHSGDTVRLDSTAAGTIVDGFYFNGWTVSTSGVTTSATGFNMPASNVTVTGTFTDLTFKPTISAALNTPDNDVYGQGNTVTYEIKVTNDKSYAISNVKVSESFTGATFTAQDDVTISGGIATIASIPVEQSVTLHATYTITSNEDNNGIDNVFKIESAEADGHYFIAHADADYPTATATFKTVTTDSSAVLTGVTTNIWPFIGLIAVSVIGFLVAVVRRSSSMRKESGLRPAFAKFSSSLAKRIRLPRWAYAGFAILLGVFGATFILTNTFAASTTATIAFYANCGDSSTVFATSDAIAQDTLVSLTTAAAGTPSCSGYVFEGWSITNNSASGFVMNDDKILMPATNVAARAKWGKASIAKEQSYSEKSTAMITYKSNYAGGAADITDTPSLNTNTAIKTDSTFSRNGYNLTKWNTASNGSGTDYTLGGSYSFDDDITLYAQWEASTRKLTVNPNGGTWEGSTDSQEFEDSPNATKTISDPAASASQGTITITFNANSQSATWTNPNTGSRATLSSNTTYAATKSFTGWTLSGGGSINSGVYTFGDTDGTITANYDNSTITLPAISKTNADACYWAEGATTGTLYAAGTERTVTAATTYYAVCKYTVTINIAGTGVSSVVLANSTYGSGTKANTGGTVSSSGKTVQLVYGQSYTLTANMSSSSYHLASWATTTTGTTYLGSTTANPTTFKQGGTVKQTLTATGTANKTLSYNLNGGSGTAPSSQSITAVTLKLSASSSPTRSGYKFVGWGQDTGTPKDTYLNGDTITTGTADITMYAVWAQTGTMQNWSGCSAAATHTRWYLTDNRESSANSYYVGKAADGKCWMLQNLRLGINSTSLSLTTANTQTAFTLNGKLSNGKFTASTNNNYSNTNDSSQYFCRTDDYGCYYNWYTATAGTGSSSTTSGSVSGSICPAGWKLPTGGSGANFASLYANTNYNSAAKMLAAADDYVNNTRASIPGFTLGGLYRSSGAYNVGAYGYFWSSTARSGRDAYSLYLGTSSVNATSNDNKYIGYSVRCITE